jgi:O-antigen ligase
VKPKAKSPADTSLPGVPGLRTAEKFFALVCGLWIGLGFLKFGNPIIFDRMIPPPANWTEFIFTAWPISWGYVLLFVVVIAAIPLLKPHFDRRTDSLVLCLGLWLIWQVFSNARSIDPHLSNPTLIHLITCGVAFLLGWWALAPLRAHPWFWTPLLLCFFYALFNGFDQHNGGLDATRKAFFAQPNWQQLYPKEYILRIESNRVFSTLVYPNAFAGLLLLLLPAALWQCWQVTARWPRVARGVLVGLFAYLGLACFFWTGSKGGWLIALIALSALAVQTKVSRRVKMLLIVVGVTLGLTAFFIRFSSYFHKGATSVSARFIYWKAAAEITKMHPLLGTGPGTFSVLFKELKPPEAEMAKLVHNDYLEQACDSGIPGALMYFAAIASLLALTGRSLRPEDRLDSLLWLGLLGWALQGFIEFGLYIPGLAWPAFLFFGALFTRTRTRPTPVRAISTNG